MDYISSLRERLRLAPAIKNDLIRELRAHFEDKIGELREAGLPESDASEATVRLMGSPQLIAQQIYEVYSQGSWRQTLFAILPHFLTASLFVLRWWANPVWLLVILSVVIAVVIYGWCHGKPAWLFSWLGYLLIPVVAAGVMLLYLPGGWAWVATLVYVPAAVFVLVVVAKQILKIDWLFVSLMLAPLPIVLGWVVVLSTVDTFLGSELVYEAASWIALSFAVLALAVATFIRAGRRWIKAIAILICSAMVLFVAALVGSNNSVSLWVWLFLSLLALLHFFGPALLERKIRGKSDSGSQGILL